MSAIDQAFVRAYARDQSPPAVADVRPGGAVAGIELVCDGPHAAVPAPHVQFDGAAVAKSDPSESRPVDQDLERQRADRGRTTKSAGALIEPAFEVDRFSWPDVCRLLLTCSSDELRRLAGVLDAQESPIAKTVLVGECARGEGRTTLLLSLALLVAGDQRRVALVDADFESPRLAQRLGIAPELGWDDVLEQGAPATEGMVESIADSITLVPLRNPVRDTGGLVRNPRLGATIAMLRRQFDLVLIAGRTMGDKDVLRYLTAIGGGRSIDLAVLVHDRRVTSEAALGRAAEMLSSTGVGSLGIVENFA